ncbi:hypothetical protein ACFSVJ_11550 [Prauserella oleivorans]
MRRKRGGTLAAIAMAGVLALTGCGGSDGGDAGAQGGGSGELKIGLAYDIGGAATSRSTTPPLVVWTGPSRSSASR